MRKNLGLLIGFMISFEFLIAQQQNDSSKKKQLNSFSKTTIGIATGLEWEQKIGKTSTINLFDGVYFGQANDDFYDYSSKWGFVPDTYLEYRNYYNFFRRVRMKRKTDFNSANFFFGRVEIYYPVRNQNFFNLLFVQGWGAQRCIWKRLNVCAHLGVVEHFYYDKPPTGGFNYIKIEPLIDFTFSYPFF
jgi:hypothetical protein